MVMWDEIAAEVAAEFPDVRWDKMLVDAMTVRMTLKPQSIDTIVATNLHADILSDLAASLAGSLGIAATANLNPWTEAKVDTKNPDRGPLLIIDGEYDHTVPWAVANASYKRQKRNQDVTEIIQMPGRGHCLTIDHGWREVADTALGFVEKYAGR